MEAMKSLVEAIEKGNAVDLSDPKILQKFTLLPKEDTPLHIAASVGNLNLVKLIIEKKPSFAWDKNKYGLTPLHIASALGHLDIVEALLDLGSGNLCRLQDDQGRTPLHYAAMNEEKDVIKRLASECPETLGMLTTDEEAPLHLALKSKNSDTIRTLVEDLGFNRKKILQNCSSLKILAKETRQGQIFEVENRGWLRRLLDSVPQKGYVYHIDRQTSQVVAALILNMTFQAALHPPSTVLNQDMKRAHPTNTLQRLFIATNFIGFMSSMSLLFPMSGRIVAEFDLQKSKYCLVISYVIIFASLTTDTASLVFLSAVCLLHFSLVAEMVAYALRKKNALRVQPTTLDQVPLNANNEQVLTDDEEHNFTSMPNIGSPTTSTPRSPRQSRPGV